MTPATPTISSIPSPDSIPKRPHLWRLLHRFTPLGRHFQLPRFRNSTRITHHTGFLRTYSPWDSNHPLKTSANFFSSTSSISVLTRHHHLRLLANQLQNPQKSIQRVREGVRISPRALPPTLPCAPSPAPCAPLSHALKSALQRASSALQALGAQEEAQG